MKHQEILTLLSHYEEEHPVETYRFYDWNVWPLLRATCAYEAANASRFKASRWAELALQSRFARRIIRAKNQLLAGLLKETKAEIDPNSLFPTTAGREVVILTLSGRRQKMGSCFYEIYADPMAEFLEQKGVQNITWERGQERSPRCYPSAWISRSLMAEALKMPPPVELHQPPWFADFCQFALTLLGRTVSWAEIEARIQLVQQFSLIFQRWLTATGAKLLISICWYDPEVMAATLAAKRLGLVSADLQHGVQGNTHYAYANWVKTPIGGYEAIPNVFLTWGDESARQLMVNNPTFSAQSKAQVVGNLWFNKWRDRQISSCDDLYRQLQSKINIGRKAILVTLQHGFEYEKFFFDTILNSPEDWFWLIRVHPATPQNELQDLDKILRTIPKSKFDSTLASELPLYTLLNFVDVHLTETSTTALEALGFGVPTITMSAAGRDRFAAYLDTGVMYWASSAEDLLHKIRLCESISATQCHQASEAIFASSAAANNGLDQLLAMAGIEKKETPCRK